MTDNFCRMKISSHTTYCGETFKTEMLKKLLNVRRRGFFCISTLVIYKKICYNYMCIDICIYNCVKVSVFICFYIVLTDVFTVYVLHTRKGKIYELVF